MWRWPETRLVWWTLVIAFVVVPWMELQNHTHWMNVQWIPLVTPPVKVIDIIVNVLLYWPFGYCSESRPATALHGEGHVYAH